MVNMGDEQRGVSMKNKWRKSITTDGWLCEPVIPPEWDHIQHVEVSVERAHTHTGPFALEVLVRDRYSSFRYRIGEHFQTALVATHHFETWWEQNQNNFLGWFGVMVSGCLWQDGPRTASDQEVMRISRNIMARHSELLEALAA